MADTLGKFTIALKKFYEQVDHVLMGGKQGIDQFLFNTDDIDTSSQFAIDRLIKNPYGVAFRRPGEQSAVRKYSPGTGMVYDVPHTSEKTPISENLRDSVVAGVEAGAGFSSQDVALMSQIVTQHVAAHTATRWKLALDTLRTGSFTPLGIGGVDIGLTIDFGRDGSLAETYNFTAPGASISEALKEMYDLYIGFGAPPQDATFILGDSWLAKFADDTDVQAYMQANVSNIIVTQNLVPSQLMNTEGLYLVARYLIPGTVTPVNICGFRPTGSWYAYDGASAAAFMPATEAVMFSISDKRYRVFRGCDALDEGGKAVRLAGELIMDSYNEKDPVTEYLRTQSRYCFVPAAVNHTVKSVGTFS